MTGMARQMPTAPQRGIVAAQVHPKAATNSGPNVFPTIETRSWLRRVCSVLRRVPPPGRPGLRDHSTTQGAEYCSEAHRC